MKNHVCTYTGRYIVFISAQADKREDVERILRDDHIPLRFCSKTAAYEVQCQSREERDIVRHLIEEAMAQADIHIQLTNYTLPEKYFAVAQPTKPIARKVKKTARRTSKATTH
jgi:hypothetical protein